MSMKKGPQVLQRPGRWIAGGLLASVLGIGAMVGANKLAHANADQDVIDELLQQKNELTVNLNPDEIALFNDFQQASQSPTVGSNGLSIIQSQPADADINFQEVIRLHREAEHIDASIDDQSAIDSFSESALGVAGGFMTIAGVGIVAGELTEVYRRRRLEEAKQPNLT